MLASYENWKAEIGELTEECLLHKSDEDLKAVEYAEQLDEDILLQMFQVITNVPCTDGDMVTTLSELASKME